MIILQTYRGFVPEPLLEPSEPRRTYLCPCCGELLAVGDEVYRVRGQVTGCGHCVEPGYLEEDETEDDEKE